MNSPNAWVDNFLFEKIFKQMINGKKMITLSEEVTKNLVFELKDTWNSDADVREIIRIMETPKTSKYGPVGMDVENVEEALIEYYRNPLTIFERLFNPLKYLNGFLNETEKRIERKIKDDRPDYLKKASIEGTFISLRNIRDSHIMVWGKKNKELKLFSDGIKNLAEKYENMFC